MSTIQAELAMTVIHACAFAFRFTSKERDAETGLDWFETRYFSSAQGRFTSPDAPFAGQHAEDPQSWNMYSYVRNNPLRYTDPDGRDCSQGFSSCVDYLIGGAKAVANLVPATATLVNRVFTEGENRGRRRRSPGFERTSSNLSALEST